MKKSVFKSLIGVAMATMVLGGEIGVASSVDKKPAKAEAASKTFYFIPGSSWDKDGATFKIDFRNGSDGWLDKRYSMTKQSYKTWNNLSIYSYTATDSTLTDVGKLHFGRFSADGNTQWNYIDTALNYDGNNLVYVVTSSAMDNPSASNSDHFPDKRIVDESSKASSSTGRIFVNNYGSGWTDGNIGVRCWGGSATSSSGNNRYEATIYSTNWFQDKSGDDQSWYGWIDIPTNVDGFQFVKLSEKSTTADIWNYQNGNSFTVSDNCFAQVYYASNGYSSGADISTGGAKNDKSYQQLLAKFIEAYDTCANSALNGYAAYNSLNTNIFSHAQAGQTSAIVTSLNGKSATIAEHIAGMAARATGLNSKTIPMIPGLTNNNGNDSYIWIIVTSVITVAGVSVFFFLKKRKEDK